MESVIVLWSAAAAAAMVLAVLCGLMWLMDRRDTASLMLCILGISTAAAAYVELGLMHARTPEEFGAWIRWYHLPLFPALVAQVFFVHFYLESSTKWLMWGVVLTRSFIFIANFLLQPNYHFSSIESVHFVSVLGAQVSAIEHAVPRRGLQSIAVLSLLLLFLYVMSAAVRCWRKGGAEQRRRALAVGLAEGLPMLLTILYGQLVIFGVLGGPISNIPWFLGALLIMGYVSVHDFVLSRRARLEAAELRSQLAQIERINLLGRLASALSHELSQPMSAMSLNLGAALKRLKQAPPDTAELAAILNDVDNDNDRAIDIIKRIRQLFKQRAIELNPIRVEDAVKNAVSLAEAEAKAKSVALQLGIPPGLPLVSGDSIHLSQVLLNLLMNGIQAVQSRPADARQIVIEARADLAKGEVEVCVRDSGPGVPGTIVHRIFDPLFTTKPEGMGMGLAISHTIIEAHGGRLWVGKDAGQEGAAFHFTLRAA
ncbi:sensor histidine kinase [Dongia sp.]|uniref:sensor histidine kinase n=1 Tax=Dongia sp. TaxID=1977262 RepID=UPI003753DFBD